MLKTPQISIIIPCYNQGEYLFECIDSLQKQTFQDFEIIIVNDGSSDPSTLNFLKEIKQNSPLKNKLNILNQENKGLPGARNTGIKKSAGTWILPLDADDKLAPNFLESTLQEAKTQNLDFVATHIQHFGLKNSIYKTHLWKNAQYLNNFLPYCALFSKEIFENEKYDPQFNQGFEDWELWNRILKSPKKFKGSILPEPLFFYRKKKNSMLQDVHKNYIKRLIQLWKKQLNI